MHFDIADRPTKLIESRPVRLQPIRTVLLLAARSLHRAPRRRLTPHYGHQIFHWLLSVKFTVTVCNSSTSPSIPYLHARIEVAQAESTFFAVTL